MKSIFVDTLFLFPVLQTTEMFHVPKLLLLIKSCVIFLKWQKYIVLSKISVPMIFHIRQNSHNIP